MTYFRSKPEQYENVFHVEALRRDKRELNPIALIISS